MITIPIYWSYNQNSRGANTSSKSRSIWDGQLSSTWIFPLSCDITGNYLLAHSIHPKQLLYNDISRVARPLLAQGVYSISAVIFRGSFSSRTIFRGCPLAFGKHLFPYKKFRVVSQSAKTKGFPISKHMNGLTGSRKVSTVANSRTCAEG